MAMAWDDERARRLMRLSEGGATMATCVLAQIGDDPGGLCACPRWAAVPCGARWTARLDRRESRRLPPTAMARTPAPLNRRWRRGLPSERPKATWCRQRRPVPSDQTKAAAVLRPRARSRRADDRHAAMAADPAPAAGRPSRPTGFFRRGQAARRRRASAGTTAKPPSSSSADAGSGTGLVGSSTV